jgi:hypothetical protein
LREHRQALQQPRQFGFKTDIRLSPGIDRTDQQATVKDINGQCDIGRLQNRFDTASFQSLQFAGTGWIKMKQAIQRFLQDTAGHRFD